MRKNFRREELNYIALTFYDIFPNNFWEKHLPTDLVHQGRHFVSYGVSKLMRVALDNQQLISGTSKPILESIEDINYVEDSWIMTLRRLITQANIQFSIHGSFTITTSTENDMSVMDVFL